MNPAQKPCYISNEMRGIRQRPERQPGTDDWSLGRREVLLSVADRKRAMNHDFHFSGQVTINSHTDVANHIPHLDEHNSILPLLPGRAIQFDRPGG